MKIGGLEFSAGVVNRQNSPTAIATEPGKRIPLKLPAGCFSIRILEWLVGYSVQYLWNG